MKVKIKHVIALLLAVLMFFVEIPATNYNHIDAIATTTYSISKSNYGDINEDGSVNVRDVSLVQKYIQDHTVLSIEQQIYADLNADGEINEKDIEIITYIYIGSNEDYVDACKTAWYQMYSAISEEDVTLAEYEANTYSFTSNINTVVVMDEDIAITVVSARKTDLSVTGLQIGNTDIKVILSDSQVYVIHVTVAGSYTVTFNANGGSVSTSVLYR